MATPLGMRALLRTLLTLALAFADSAFSQEAAPYRTIAEIRGMDRSKLNGPDVVKVRGVVTLTQDNSFIVQDETDAIYVQDSKGESALVVGDFVDVIAEIIVGRFAPVMRLREVRKLGTRNLPQPASVHLSDLRTGRFDCHLVVLRGVGRDIMSLGRLPQVTLATASGPVIVLVEEGGTLDEAKLVDAELEVTGCCFSFFNPRGESTGVNLRVQNTQALRVIRPPPDDPFSVPEIVSAALRPFSRAGPNLNRQRLTGIVTLSSAPAYFYLQNEHHGFRVYTTQPHPLQPGEVVEVSGFVDPGTSFSVINNALVRRKGLGQLPEPVPITWADVMRRRSEMGSKDYDGSFVRLVGELIKFDSVPQQPQRLYLDHGGMTITATFAAREPDEALASLKVGAQLELRGVCEVSLAAGGSPSYQPVVEKFGLIVDSAEFIRVLEAPPWWTIRRLATLLMVTLVLLFVSIGAVILFRRLALTRSQELAAEVLARETHERARRENELEFQATLRERERLAADLHDTVEQSLTGVALQLDATRRAPDPTTAGRNLGLATQMLSRSREDVRRSVWNLRAQALEGQLLRDALRQIAGSLLEGAGLTISVGGCGREVALPDVTAGNLLMLAKEATTNVLKHAGATRLEIRVDYGADAVTLTIEDNGHGFDVTHALGPHAGHFGLTGMKERAARLHGEFTIASKPGSGTVITIRTSIQ